ncbi:MAG: serine hydrolase domain-containing protein [Pseudomonadota bacterium]|nr:serine hydrolase domain-containing protein [Pseudomonadota bacterium]
MKNLKVNLNNNIVSPESVGLDSRVLKNIGSYLEDYYINPGKLIGTITLVARKGEIAYLDSLGMMDREKKIPMKEDAIFRIFSMTKPITSIALMQLYEKSLFRLDDPVHWYIPSWKNLRVYQSGVYPNFITSRPNRHMTIRDLLTHMSGLTYHFMYRTNVDAAYRLLGIGTHGAFGEEGASGHNKSEDGLEEMVNMLSTLPLEFSPGDQWNYSVSTDVLGHLIELFSGMKLDDYFQKNIFEPLEMKDTGFLCPKEKLDRLTSCYEHQVKGNPKLVDSPKDSWTLKQSKFLSGGGGLVSTISDYYNFLSMLLSQGEFNSTRIIGRKSLQIMTINHLPSGQDLTDMSQSAFSETPYKGIGFGLGFSIMLDPAKSQVLSDPGEFGWGGMASTVFWVNPKEEMLVIFLTQLIPSVTYQVRRELRTLSYSALMPE